MPGDVVLLEAGDRVPADGRLVVAANLSIDESALTGESVPVEKDVDRVGRRRPPLGDRHRVVFMNTTVVRGRAEMVVTATGMATEMGKVAELLGGSEVGETPLQRQLDRLGKRLALIAGVAVGLVFVLQLAAGRRLRRCRPRRAWPWPWPPSPRVCPRSSPSPSPSASPGWPSRTPS